MERITLLITIVMTVVILSGCGPKVDVSITSTEYHDDFWSSQESELEEIYEGKAIGFTGIAWKLVDGDIFEGVFLYNGVQCHLDIDSLDKDVVAHKKVTVVGTGDLEYPLLHLRNCTVQDVDDKIDHTLVATDLVPGNEPYDALDIVEITGTINRIIPTGDTVLVILQGMDTVEFPVSFYEDVDLSSFASGDDVLIHAVWDGEVFAGYYIK